MRVDINTRALVRLSHKLEQINRSALPVAVRGTLNNAAFDVKKNTMPKTAASSFTQRKPSFFKARSRVMPATGFSVNGMKATAGFIGKDQAVEDLNQQQFGGKIKGRAYIPMAKARVSGSSARNVRAVNRISKIKNIVTAGTGRSKKQNFIRAAIWAKKMHGNDAYVLAETKGNSKTLFRIDRIAQGIRSRKLVLKATPLYDYDKGRTVSVKRTNFMGRAADISGKKMPKFFEQQAQRQFNRVLR